MIEEIKIDRLEELVQEMMKKIRDTHPTNSAEGNPIEIENAAAAPLVKCVTAITGSQSGSGTPSPDNVRPITAYSSGTIEVEDEDGNSTTYSTSFPDAIYKGTEDVVNKTIRIEKKCVDFSDLTWTLYGPNLFFVDIADKKNAESASTVDDILCTNYKTASGDDVVTQGQDYSVGGSVNNGRVFVRDSRCSDVTEFNAANVSSQLVYTLATPATASVTVSNAPVSAVHGYNKIESSTGDMEVTYITEEFEPLVPTT